MSTLPKHPHELIGDPDRSATRRRPRTRGTRAATSAANTGPPTTSAPTPIDDLGYTAGTHERRRMRQAELAQCVGGVSRVDGLERTTEHDQRARDHERAREHTHGVVVVVGGGPLVVGGRSSWAAPWWTAVQGSVVVVEALPAGAFDSRRDLQPSASTALTFGDQHRSLRVRADHHVEAERAAILVEEELAPGLTGNRALQDGGAEVVGGQLTRQALAPEQRLGGAAASYSNRITSTSSARSWSTAPLAKSPMSGRQRDRRHVHDHARRSRPAGPAARRRRTPQPHRTRGGGTRGPRTRRVASPRLRAP